MSLTLTDKILIRLNNARGISSYADIDPTHGAIGCAGCHGGVAAVDAADDTSAFRAAHKGVVRDPSAIGEEGCSGGMCHADIVRRNETSMHSNLWGEKAHVALRNGYASYEECPADMKESYESDCASCHTTCGQCHVSIPNGAGGGFLDQRAGYSHQFIRTPDEANVCTACHGSRVGDDWNANQERVPGNLPDVHNDFGYTCLDCHQEDMHGDGISDMAYTSRYETRNLPQCVDCHQVDSDDNAFHAQHWPNGDKEDGSDLACYTCHSQQYNNCNTCHAGTWQQEYESDNSGEYRVYPQFKIGKNPYYQQADHPHKEMEWITVRHIPVSPDAYTNWGINVMSNYAAMETWKYASPHNIRRWTERTLADSAWLTTPSYDETTCTAMCHYHDDSDANLNHYLVDEDMLPEREATGDDLSGEIEANAHTSLGALAGNEFCAGCHPSN